MKVCFPRSFQRDASKQGVDDKDCIAAIERAERGLIDADIGAGLIKQRIPRQNMGAARGARSIIFYRRGKVAIFLHLFPKSAKANLTPSELNEYRKLAAALEKLTDAQLGELSETRGWKDIDL